MNNNTQLYTSNYMISFDKARELIKSNCINLENEQVVLEAALGRVLAENVEAPISVPSFNNSAMDGYAVNAVDLLNASKEAPVSLKLIGLTAAGDNIAQADLTSQCAWKIMTGAPVPIGFDAIIPVENTELTETAEVKTILCFSSPKSAENIRYSGEDFLQGERVLNQKIVINANSIKAMASLGIAEVRVKKKPRIAVFSTGKELINDLKQDLKLGQIYNSNMPYILNYLKELPVNAHNAGTNYDDAQSYQKALQKELNNEVHIVISTGAVSMGDFDFIPSTIKRLGGEIIFHKTKIRPGKPILFAKFPNGTLYFGLPGNPISANIGLRFFVMHCLRKMLNLNPEKVLKAKMNHAHTKKHSFVGIQKANAYIDELGSQRIDILDGQESFKIQPLLNANGWAVLYEGEHYWDENDLVSFYPS